MGYIISIQPPSGGCVLKLSNWENTLSNIIQPPSGGCVLKRLCIRQYRHPNWSQPPSGGCVLKPWRPLVVSGRISQPPSGGCVLKRFTMPSQGCWTIQPPSGGCVLKLFKSSDVTSATDPAAFRRLCVETWILGRRNQRIRTSRLQAAVC